MRLTLRTLLAYLDDILDPEDQRDLEQQIAASANAGDLIHRTRDAARRLRLGAPPAVGEGLEADPNIPAEYLDSTLSPEVVAEFEKVCLESDVNLAEVASCHHVLTMVLGEPAEVDPAMRDRMYELADNPHHEHRGSIMGGTAPESGDSSAAVQEPATAASDEVPDYLRPERSFATRFAVAALVLIVAGAGWFFTYGPDGLLRRDREVVENTPETDDDDEPNLPPDAGSPENPPDDDTTTDENGTATTPPDPNEASASTPNEVGEGLGNPLPEDGGEALELPDDLPVIEPVDESQPDADDGSAEGDDGTMVGEAGDGVEPTPDPTPPEATDPEIDDVNPIVDAGPPEVVPSGPLGAFVSVHQILLRYDGVNDRWNRLPKNSDVLPGDTLLALPTYRPEVDLMSGLRVELSNATRVVVDADELGTVLQLAYGRVVVTNTAAEPVVVTITIDDMPQVFELARLAAVAVEVQRQFVPGMPIGEVASPSMAIVYATGKSVVRIEPDGTRLPLEAPSQWQVSANGPGPIEAIAVEPEWLTGQKLEFLQQTASRSIEQAFDAERAARVQLLSFYENTKRSEERDLAARCALHVGQLTPFVLALSDSAQRANWEEHIEMLRLAIAASPELAAKVMQTVEQQRGTEEAEDLYEMIRGYTRAQLGSTPQALQTGVLQKLIGWLENDRLEYRVLAFHNLRQLTGKSLLFQPSGSPTARERSIRTWRERLEDNELIVDE